MSNLIEINKLDEIDNGTISLVTIYQTNCGTCDVAKMMIEIVSETLKNVNFYKLNITGKSDIILKYKIRSVPYFLLLKDGEVIESFAAFHSVTYLYEFIRKYID